MKTEEIQRILPHCNISNIKTHSPEWHKHRRTLINSSELGIITKISKYGSGVKLYYEKLGLAKPFESNEFTFLGSYYEDSIKDLWQYHTGEQGSYIKNYEEGRKIRGFVDIDCYLSNPKFPWLSGSVDGLIDPNAHHGLNLATMSRLDGFGVLECKRVSSWADRSYDGEVNPSHLLQVLSYMTITGLKYGEIASMLEGGLRLDVVLPDKDVQQSILDVSKSWYDNHLVPGLAAKKKLDQAMVIDDISAIEDATAEIQNYEPEPDGSDDYKQFISDTFTKDREFISAPDWLYEDSKSSVTIKKMINELEGKRKLLTNKISAEHGKQSVEYFSFGRDQELGYSRYYMKGKNKRNELNLKVKETPDEDYIKREIQKLSI
jgi:predicted phage-related endonuclease